MEKLRTEIQLLLKLFKLRKLNKAELFNKNLIKNYPKTVYLYNILGLILIEQKKIDEAIQCYKNAIEIKPDFFPVYDNLGTAYKLKGLYDEAENYYKKAINLNKNAPGPQNNLGNLYNLTNKSFEAIECYKKAIDINPKFFTSHYNIGIVYKNLGMFKEAKKNLEEAVKLNINLYAAHRSLGELTKYTKNTDHYNILKKIYNEKKNIPQKAQLLFALGKASEDIEDFDKAFQYYKEGNELRRKELSFSIMSEKKLFTNIKKTFNKQLFKKFKNSGSQDSSAIFILGMPRSGTTLVEQILSSHPRVFGGDELNFLINIVKKHIVSNKKNFLLKKINKFDKNIFKKIGNEYIKNIKNISNNADIITDKLPINFKWVGLIKLILPNSKIIHCVRNSKDNCLSIFKNYFVNPELNFAYNLKEISQFYNLYISLVKHWNKTLPGFLIDVKYEKIVKDPHNEIRGLLKKSNLAWNENCLKFYKNKRLIKTASDTQARKKIYKSSVGSWIKYKKNLGNVFK